MLGSSVLALVARVTIQKWALQVPNGLAYVPKKGSRAFQPRVRSFRVLRHLGIVRGALVTVQ